MNASNVELQKATLYQSCNDEYKRGVMLNRENISKSFPNIDSHNEWEVIPEILNSSKEAQKEYFISRGTSIPPDEILQKFASTGIKVPMRSREEVVASGNDLPLLDLLNVLHYYTSSKIHALDENSRLKLENNFDESALLSLGALVEDMADKLVGLHGLEIFVERESDIESGEDDSISSESDDGNDDSDDHDDSAGSISDISF